MSIIELKGVSFIYGKKSPYEIHALDDVNLSIEKGMVTGIIGHTGSGKSTLIQMLNGLIRPDEGTVTINGVDIWEKPKQISKIRYIVGMVMQYPEYQLFADTVREDIAYGPKNMGVSDEEIKIRVAESARFCGLTDEDLDKSPFDLSGGQKRRVALAGVMAMDPEILVLDEPAAGLDPRGRKEILGGIAEYKKTKGKTIVIVSHSMEDMAMYCDEIAVMSHGKMILKGDCRAIFSEREMLRSAGLDVPEITNLVYALKEKGVDISKSIYTVDGAFEAIKRSMNRGDNHEL